MNTHALFSPHTTSATNIVSLVQHHTPSFSVTPMDSDISIFFTQVASCEGKPSHHSMAFLMQSFIDSSSRNVEANGMTQRCLNLIWCLSTQTSIFVSWMMVASKHTKYQSPRQIHKKSDIDCKIPNMHSGAISGSKQKHRKSKDKYMKHSVSI